RERLRSLASETQRRQRRRPAPPRTARLLGPVPPRRLPRPSRQPAPLRRLLEAHRQRRMKVMVIGSGPIVIGQAAEFDYAGTQACRALREEGHTTVLVNSNPATIMTDAGVADRTYVEPLTPEFL